MTKENKKRAAERNQQRLMHYQESMESSLPNFTVKELYLLRKEQGIKIILD